MSDVMLGTKHCPYFDLGSHICNRKLQCSVSAVLKDVHCSVG